MDIEQVKKVNRESAESNFSQEYIEMIKEAAKIANEINNSN